MSEFDPPQGKREQERVRAVQLVLPGLSAIALESTVVTDPVPLDIEGPVSVVPEPDIHQDGSR